MLLYQNLVNNLEPVLSRSNPDKSKCMVSGRYPYKSNITLKIRSHAIPAESELEILGCIFSSDGSPHRHIEQRITKSRRAMYGLTSAGCSSTCSITVTEKKNTF